MKRKIIMNKIMWKLYLNSIINTHESEPIPFPDNNRQTYCFKLTKNFENELTICPRIGLTSIDHLKILYVHMKYESTYNIFI